MTHKREKIIASIICICMMLSIAASCVFAENEEITAPEGNEEDTAVVEEPTTTQEDVVEEPTTTKEDIVEEPTPTQQDVVVEPGRKQEITDDSAPEGSGTETPDPAEETKESALPEENTKDKFDLEKAYEHYLSLEEEWQREQYLNSLSSEQRAELKEYIIEKEETAKTEDILTDSEDDNDSENTKTGDEEESSTEEKQDNTSDGDGTEKPMPESSENNDGTPDADDDSVTGENTEETHTSFGCAYISGEWFGRNTSGIRYLTILIYIDGNLVDTCCTSANRSVADFVIYAGDNEIIDVSSDYWELSGSGNLWSVDMYGANTATVSVYMKSLSAAAESAPETAAMTQNASPEELSDELQEELSEEPQEDKTAQPAYEIRIPVTTISMSREAGTAKLTIDASCTDMDGKRLDVKCISDHDFHFVYGDGKDSIEYGLYASEGSKEKLSNGQTAVSFTEDASANIYLRVNNGEQARFAGEYEDIITFSVAMITAE